MQHLYGGWWPRGMSCRLKKWPIRGDVFSAILNWLPESILCRYSNNLEHQWCDDGSPLIKEATLMCPTLQSWRLALNENLLHAGSPVSNMTKNLFLSWGTFHLSELSSWPFLSYWEFHFLYYYMRNFCNLIGLEQWYFILIWNTYMWKLQTFRG